MKQMSERSEAVTVRRLPDGPVQPARIESREGHQLLLSSLSEGEVREFPSGALLEIQSGDSIYLGAVLCRQDSGTLVAVEHVIHRAALAEIEEAWHSPQAG
ncbi:MAG TPA: hypothetical protein VGN17_08195 [Bryobacteraceae bacterium]|jgi:hypothetical protein